MPDKPEQESPEVQTHAEFRPLTRLERRTLWLNEYGAQDLALQSWARIVEQQGIEVEVMFQMQGLLIFGVMVSTEAYAQFYINLHEDMYRKEEPETADFLRDYYTSLIPSAEQQEIGPEGLPIMYRYAHLRDVTIMSAGHKVKLPYWRGKLNEIDAFVLGASAAE
ncbi:MAG TPA: hypothetical protein VGN34_20025 [Ktedonobacteraceae bacterium]|jgi:hypothetical protein